VGLLQQDTVELLQQDTVELLRQETVELLQQDTMGLLQQETMGLLQQDTRGLLQQDTVGRFRFGGMTEIVTVPLSDTSERTESCRMSHTVLRAVCFVEAMNKMMSGAIQIEKRRRTNDISMG